MVDSYSGSLFYFGGKILLGTRGLETDFHAHFAVSILISISEPFCILTDEKEKTYYQAAFLAPNFHHMLLAENSDMIVLQFDPYSKYYASLLTRFGRKGIKEIPIEEVRNFTEECKDLLEAKLDCESARSLFESILGALGTTRPEAKLLDPRIAGLVEKMKISLREDLSVPILAGELGFSESRFMHLFKEEIGIPFRQYLLWMKLHEAAKILQSGGNLTDASHAAGFADQSHLSRTFKRMFGVPPSKFLGANHKVKLFFCS
ncbi:helix-turn-helix transcriptional regulator [Leptospira ilyithenensis]|uniref:AraC family transcriptional regulator n=1 Tax=Leptospira ilyithenensis TaxID=2484901 RepID=A0A4R9LSM8_9LEPT|nr:helix-turn-helix transcriptional regulator [Leptospira ilyithenensis]TGN12003.1 AraC family transcriptional regulator [Leptospira ilyithenensis]